jgi:hypothetical protein
MPSGKRPDCLNGARGFEVDALGLAAGVGKTTRMFKRFEREMAEEADRGWKVSTES